MDFYTWYNLFGDNYNSWGEAYMVWDSIFGENDDDNTSKSWQNQSEELDPVFMVLEKKNKEKKQNTFLLIFLMFCFIVILFVYFR